MNDIDFSKIWLVSFADSRLYGCLKRVRRQAIHFGFHKDKISILTEKDLNQGFVDTFSTHLVKGSRGFGYWCWKPQVVLQNLNKMRENDILIYMDAGCHLNIKGKKRFCDYVEAAEKHDICGFQTFSLLGTTQADSSHHIRLERELTKGDVIDFFNVRNNSQIVDSAQLLGGIFFVKKNLTNIAFFERMLNIFKDHWNLIDDSPSNSPNLNGFYTHRHDQSVFSIMMKLRRAYVFSAFECEPLLHHAPSEYAGNHQWGRSDFYDMSDFPIHARRDKSSGIFAYLPVNFRVHVRKMIKTVLTFFMGRLIKK